SVRRCDRRGFPGGACSGDRGAPGAGAARDVVVLRRRAQSEGDRRRVEGNRVAGVSAPWPGTRAIEGAPCGLARPLGEKSVSSRLGLEEGGLERDGGTYPPTQAVSRSLRRLK